MNNRIAVYGFTEEQLVLLKEHMADEYVCKEYDDAVGLISAHCICAIICSEDLDTKSREFLNSFYLDVGENVDEQVIWIDSKTQPPVLEGIYFHYNSLSELLLELDAVLANAENRLMVTRRKGG